MDPITFVTDWSAEGLLAITIILILTGRLIPAKDRDYWRDVAIKATDQNKELLEAARTTNAVLKAIKPKDDEQ